MCKICGKEFNSPESVYLHQIETDHFEPKERTIEDVEVGDVVVNSEGTMPTTVLKVEDFGFAHMDEISGKMAWNTFKFAIGEGWKIKQPEPEKKERPCGCIDTICASCNKQLAEELNEREKEKWLEKGEKEGWLKEYMEKEFKKIVQC